MLLSPQKMNAACDTNTEVTTEYAVYKPEKLFDRSKKHNKICTE
jgi:hypothetical protein